MTNGIPTWTSKTTYVDIETGELMTKTIYERSYYHIKTLTQITINKNKSRGHKQYTKIGRKKPEQLKII